MQQLAAILQVHTQWISAAVPHWLSKEHNVSKQAPLATDCVCACMQVHTHTLLLLRSVCMQMHECWRECVCVHANACMLAWVCVCACKCTHADVSVCVCMQMHTCWRECVCVHANARMLASVCVCANARNDDCNKDYATWQSPSSVALAPLPHTHAKYC